MACNHCAVEQTMLSNTYRKILWVVFSINAVMFIVEILVGLRANSVSLLADSLDFLGDSANYLISLLVLGKSLSIRAKASLLKGITMGLVGVWVFITTFYQFAEGSLPSYNDMGGMGLAAFMTNMLAAWLLYRFRQGDSNMMSVWLCSRNDAIGNLIIILASFFVYLTHSNLPDLIVAIVMVYLSLSASYAIIRQALKELKHQ